MPEYRHPTELDDVAGKAPERIHVSRQEKAPVSDGTFTVPEDVAAAIASRFGVDVADLRVGSAVCGAELSQGGTCDRPADECPYHGGDD